MFSPFRLLPAVALLAASSVAHAADFLDFPAALDEAKRTGKDIVVLEDGSDWVPDSPALNRALADPALRRRLGDRVIWARHDNPDALPADFKEPVKPDIAPTNLPALLVVSPDGRTHAMAEGLRSDRVPAVIGAVPKILEQRLRRDLSWKKAEAASGVERARLYGAGLDLMSFDLAKARKDIRDAIKKADPDDISGYTFKYGFDQSGVGAFHEGMTMKLLEQKKYADIIAEADKRLRNPTLTPRQRQIVMTARFQAYRGRGDLPKAFDELRAIAAVAPTNDMARAAIDYLRAYTVPVRLTEAAWRSDQNPPDWVPFVLDVSKIVTAPGSYEIEFRHRAGHLRLRKMTLTAGKTELASDANTSEQRKLRLTVAALPAGPGKSEPIELTVEARGTGWHESFGEILVTKVN